MLQINFSITNLVALLTFFTGFLYAFQIGSLKKKEIVENTFFKWFLIVLSCIVFLFFLVDLKLKIPLLNITIILFVVPLILLPAPLMWLYISKLISRRIRIKPLYHLLPAIIMAVLIFIFGGILMLTSDKETKALCADILKIICYTSLVFIFLAQNILYIYLAIKGYQKHRKKVSEIYSYSEKVDLSWVKLLIFGYLTFIIGMIVVNMLHGDFSNLLFNFIVLSYIIYTGHNAMKQKSVLVREVIENPLETEPKEKNSDDKQNPIFQKIKDDLLVVMQEEKPYLDHDLNIFTLSKRLNTNSKYLSQIINQEFNMSFVHFVNGYRIEDAKNILLQNKQYTIEAQSQMVGFKSKSSFNLAFKRQTGTTPSVFIQQNQSRR